MSPDVWTFRIVDQENGTAVAGVPVSVLDGSGASVGYWVSDAEGMVTIPRLAGERLRLRVGLRSEEPIDLETRALGADPVALVAPRRGQPLTSGAHVVALDGALVPPTQSLEPDGSPAQVLRFTRVGVLPLEPEWGGVGSADLAALAITPAQYPAPIRYGALLEIEALWQHTGTEIGDLLYSVSVAPGDEVRALVQDGRWRRQAQRERPLQIVAKMIGTPTLGDRLDAVPLEPFPLADLPGAAAETVALLAERTARVCASLRRRPLGVTELHGEPPDGAAVRTVGNKRPDAVVTYHFVEPLARYRVIVRTPRVRPAMLVPFRLPNLATRNVVRQFAHVVKRAFLDRSLLPDLDAVLAPGAEPVVSASRVYAHVAGNLPYYSAAIIAAGDPGQRHQALAKLRDPAGRVLTDVIENLVVGRVGNYVAFPLRTADAVPERWRAALTRDATLLQRLSEDLTVLLPIPGVWLRSEFAQPVQGSPKEEPEKDEGREWRRRTGRRG